MERTCRGFTLVEALVSLVIIVLLAGGTLAIPLLARSTCDTLAMSTVANTHASLALRPIVLDLREAVGLTIAMPERLEIALPQVDSYGHNVVPLQVGNHASYYLSDSTGQLGRTGTTLWRAVRGAGETSPTPQRVVMEDVASLLFSYIPTSLNAHTVQLSVVARGRSGPRTTELTHTYTVNIRNSEP